MKLTIFNGSPRGANGNTKLLLEKFCEGFTQTQSNSFEIAYLNKVNKHNECAGLFENAETVLLAFPLYTDSMPGIVKAFIEALKDVKNRTKITKITKIGFMVHSGFRDGIHTAYIARYLKKLTKRLKREFIGVIRRGGSEGIKIMPPFLTKKLFARFYELGVIFGKTGCFDEDIMLKLNRPVKFSLFTRIILTILKPTGILNMYWDTQLKKNNAYKKRFDQPHLADAP